MQVVLGADGKRCARRALLPLLVSFIGLMVGAPAPSGAPARSWP